MIAIEFRVGPARPDSAAESHHIDVERLAKSEWREVIAPHAPLRESPSPDAPLGTEALKGEYFAIFEENGEGWCFGQLVDDGYTGWMPSSALGARGDALTHRVSALRTLIFPGPSIKLPPIESLPFGSALAVENIQGDLAKTAGGHYIPAKHLSPLDIVEEDFVAIAERFVGTPYMWGGKTNAGIDCSGLVQVAMRACGIPCPRDSGMQEGWFGGELGVDYSKLKRGDLLFWPGHVAIACDSARIVHANAFHMAVVIEPLAEAISRIAASGVMLRSIKRVSSR